MLKLFQPPACPPPQGGHANAQMQWRLAGFLTIADWIGSNEIWFPLEGTGDDLDPVDYFERLALPRARAAVAAAGITPAEARSVIGFSGLFPKITAPSPAQSWAETVPLPEGPALIVIEDLTGSGKTEAAITLAHRLLASGRGRGLFFALPSMATANAMFERMRESYRRLFIEGSRPSLALAHGKAGLDPAFRAVVAIAAQVELEVRANEMTPSEAECAAWLAEDRRRALLADVGVGTIDQALLAILPVRQAPLRLHGLQNKVLVVDEAHAFDSYMGRELQALLEFHAALGGSAILLSATLPQGLRQSLTDAFRRGLGQEKPEPLAVVAYPLATIAAADAVTEYPLAVRHGLARSVAVTRVGAEAEARARVVEAARADAAVVWIRNSVDDALETAAQLRAEGIEPIIFHARFAHVDRQAVEQTVLQRFGRDSATRAGVLIATQVVEQSLDLDFDLLVTDLAPADSLIQRAGRLWRHERGPRVLAQPEMVVLSPQPVMEADANWLRSLLPRTNSVYQDPALLWRSARALFAKSTITTPDDMRSLIEAAADAEGGTPPGLRDAADRAQGKHQGARAIAGQNVLDFAQGYTIQSGAWDAETRTPTRLEEREQVTLRLARIGDGAILPYAEGGDDLRQAWSLSEVRVAKHRLAACPVPAGLEAAAEAARSQWGRWERESPLILLAILEVTETVDRFRLHGLSDGGKAVTAFYTASSGIVWQKE